MKRAGAATDDGAAAAPAETLRDAAAEALLHTTAADAAWRRGRKKRRSGSSSDGTRRDGWCCFDEACQHRAYAARVARLERARRRHGEDAAAEYAAQTHALAARTGEADAERAADAAAAPLAAAEAGAAHAERMAAELVEAVGRRSQFSRPRPAVLAGAGGDAALGAGVNERNRRFNAKVARAYGAAECAADEIRQSLESGTAL